MTDEDKQLICEYMWWAQYKYPSYYLNTKGDIESHHFDLNDAGLVVQEMQKRGEWLEYRDFTIDFLIKELINHRFPSTDLTFWLMSMEGGVAKNFFSAFVEWRKTK